MAVPLTPETAPLRVCGRAFVDGAGRPSVCPGRLRSITVHVRACDNCGAVWWTRHKSRYLPREKVLLPTDGPMRQAVAELVREHGAMWAALDRTFTDLAEARRELREARALQTGH